MRHDVKSHISALFVIHLALFGKDQIKDVMIIT